MGKVGSVATVGLASTFSSGWLGSCGCSGDGFVGAVNLGIVPMGGTGSPGPTGG